MKFLIILALCVAAARARFELPDVVAAEAAEIQQILDLIQHPNTDPATAAALQALLEELLAPVKPVEEGIAVGPVIIENEDLHDIDVSPVIVDPVAPDAPAAPAAPAASSPLVSIIINVNSGSPDAVSIEDSPVAPRPEPVVEEPIIDPSPVIIVDKPEAPVEPVIVAPIVVPEPPVDPVIVAPIVVPEPPVDPVIVAPIVVPEPPVEPVIVAPIVVPEPPVEPVIVEPIVVPEPVVVLPDTLN